MKYKERDALVAGLRELADWLESNPRAIELPNFRLSASEYIFEYGTNPETGLKDYSHVDEFLTRLKMRKITKALGRAKKEYDSFSFSITKKFGPISLEYRTNRNAICRKVVKEVIEHPAEVRTIPARTEEVVEWVCDDPILA